MTVLLLSLAMLVLAVCALAPRRTHPWRDKTARRGSRAAARCVWAVVFVYATIHGADKGGLLPGRVGRLISVLRDGTLSGPTNAVASAAQASAVDVFTAETSNIIASAKQVITDASDDLYWLGVAATQNVHVAYLAGDITRNLPSATNVLVRIEGLETCGEDTLRAYVNFSAVPSSAPIVQMQASIAEGDWEMLSEITNSYPTTYEVATIDGPADCYRYDYEIPVAMQGMVLRPEAHVPLGGYDPMDYFSVPGGGVLVEDDVGVHVGATGWMQIPNMPSWEVRTVGGIIMEARQTL